MIGSRIIIVSLIVIGCYAQPDVSEDNMEALSHYPLDSCRLIQLKDPCCLKHGRGKGGGHGRRLEELYESYASHEEGLTPILDQAFMFAKPTSYSAKDICDAVANNNLLKPYTTLLPKKTLVNSRHEKYGKNDGGSRRLQEVIAQSSLHSSSAVTFVDGEADSPRGAQVGVVCRAGCCNVYPALAKGDAISEICENRLLGGLTGDTPDFYNLFQYATITAGTFNIMEAMGQPRFGCTGSLIIGRDLGGGFLLTNEVRESPADSGPFAGISLLIGEDVVAQENTSFLEVFDQTPNPCCQPTLAGETQIGGFNNGKVIPQSNIVNGLKYPAEIIRKIIELQVNAISSELYNMKENVANVQISTDGEVERINCVGAERDASQPCVAFVDAKHFEDPCTPEAVSKLFFVIGQSDDDLVILNIYGGKQRKSQNFFVLPQLRVGGAEGFFTLVLNFVDAETLHLGRTDINVRIQQMNTYVVVPRARSITTYITNYGSLLHGCGDGVLNQHADIREARTPLPKKAANPAVVAYCDCACPANEQIEMAKIDRKSGHKPPHSPHSPGYKPPHSPAYEAPHSPRYQPPRSPGYQATRSPGYL